MVIKIGKRTATSKQSFHFNHFLLALIAFSGKRSLIPIYRGESLERLYDKLDLDPAFNDLNQLSERLFLIGDKGRHYFSESFFGKKLGETWPIDDTSPKVFRYIFEQVRKSTKSKKEENRSFYTANRAFEHYFSSGAAKAGFLETISRLPDQDKLWVRNYYLRLIHQFSPSGYKTKSHLVSTSTSHSVASSFAKGRGHQKEAIIHAWTLPLPLLNKRLQKATLPVYRGRPYPQHEISLLAGIMPQYMIGLELPGKNAFLVNPHLFLQPISRELFINGFQINQSRFYETLQQTNYCLSFIEMNGSVYDIG
jgi:hypothetical protein